MAANRTKHRMKPQKENSREPIGSWLCMFCESLLSDSNQRPRDYKSRALAN